MSNIVTQYTQLNATFEDGAMRLLRSPFAQTTVALLREVFADGSTHLESEVLYARMDAMLDELDFVEGKIWRHADGTRLTARELVNETWVREYKLLERRIAPKPDARALLGLTEDENDLYLRLCSVDFTGPRRIEQERIPLERAQAVVVGRLVES